MARMDFGRMSSPGRFSRTEVRDISISAAVLSLAFMLMFATRKNTFILTAFEMTFGKGAMTYVGLFLACVGLVIVSFLLHEMGHKITAQKSGYWSEYRMFPAGLAFTLILSLAGFLFAAPGAVMIAGNLDSKTNGRISIAGPAVNMVFAAIGMAGGILMNGSVWVVPFYLLASLNASLGLFNLLPIPPLDGSKVIKWNVGVWIAGIAICAVEFIALMYMNFYYVI